MSGRDGDTSAPDTPAIRAARATGISVEVRVIERPRDLAEAAERLGVSPDRVLKTMVVRRGPDDHVLVLLPGDRTIAWPKLRSHLGVNRLSLPDAEAAKAATGYERGTITPFGAQGDWPVIIDASVPGSGQVTVGAGRHGTSLRLDADDLIRVTKASVADLT